RAEALARYKNRDLLASMEELQFELQRVRTARGWGQIAQHLAPDPIRFLPDYFTVAVRFTSCRALTGAVGIGIALRRHGDENEKTITTLDCLKQKYLDKIPIDPFNGEPYQLRRRHNGTIVYSVGRNLRDDHGKIQAAVPGFPPPDIGVFLEDQ
ncbi:MAG: hypothetical protein KGZ25_11705, partial [Planctomycetes bacterium]|nr:hypothetical protein [Planctomycetota bacterium]